MAEKITSPTCPLPEIHEMVNKLRSIRGRYYQLGIQLKMEPNELDVINRSNKSCDDKLTDMLVCWLKNEETHSWDEICEALRNIGEIKLAEKIQADTQSRPRRCAIAKLRHPPPKDTTVTPAWKKHRNLRRLYGQLLTNFMEYFEELDIERVKCFLGCEDYSSEEILQRMKSSMNLYNIAPIQDLVEVFPNEEMSYNVETYCQWKEQFLQSTPIREFQYQGCASPDVYEIKLKVESSLVCDRGKKLKLMDDLVQEAFGPFYDKMTEMEHPQHSAETFCWRISKLIGVEAIAYVQRNLDVLNQQGVEEVTVGNFQLMPNYCQDFSATSPPTRSMSLTQTEDNAHLKLQNHTLQTELRRLRREKEVEMRNLQSQIEDLESQLQKVQQKRKGDEATGDDAAKPSTCQQKCAKLEKEIEEVDKFYHTMLHVSKEVYNLRGNILEFNSLLDRLDPSMQIPTRSLRQGFRLLDVLEKETKNGPSYSQVERHFSKTMEGFLKENEQFMNPMLVERIRGRLQDVSSDGESCVTYVTDILQSHIVSDDVLNPVIMKDWITGRTMEKELKFEDKDEAERVLAITENQLLEEVDQQIQDEQQKLMTAPTQEGKGITMMQTKQMKKAIDREIDGIQGQPRAYKDKSSEQTSEVSGNEEHQSCSLESKSLEIAKKEIELLQNQMRIAIDQEEPHSWVIDKEEVELTEEVLGRGGYGEVKVAIFRGIRVAAKILHQIILSVYNQLLFIREMMIAAKIRHPNLLLFIGATREGEAIILTELMPTSLQKELERGDMQRKEIISIAQDVACALRYLHQWRPSPIIHRDISSANVLLEPLRNGWRAKVSDYGSANFMNAIKTATPGNPAYAAPEACYPDQHSPKMDTFSYGVLLIEMCNRRLPEPNSMEREAQILQIQWAAMASLVRRCTSERPADRPSMRDIMELLASNKL